MALLVTACTSGDTGASTTAPSDVTTTAPGDGTVVTEAPEPDQDGARFITAMSHRVHQQATTGSGTGAGIDVSSELLEQDINVAWQTLPVDQMQSRILRELSLQESAVSMVFIQNVWFDTSMRAGLMPLNSYLEDDPEATEIYSQAMLDSITVDGNLYGLPLRAPVRVLYYNKNVIDAPPATLEEMISMAREATGVNDSGQALFGLLFITTDFSEWVRGYGGEVISEDFELGLTDEPAIQALETLKALYDEGVIPDDFPVIDNDTKTRMVQQGQAAFIWNNNAGFTNFNDPEASVIAGQVGVTNIPALSSVGEYLEPEIPIWYMAIPGNAKDPDTAWEVLKHFSTIEAHKSFTLNGNGPVIPALYDDPDIAAALAEDYVSSVKQSLLISRPIWPAFDNRAEVLTILDEFVVAAITGAMSIEQAMADAEAAIAPLLPTDG